MAGYNLINTETLMVGDSKDDAQAAASNELGFVAATYGFGKLNSLNVLPDSYILSEFVEIINFI